MKRTLNVVPLASCGSETPHSHNGLPARDGRLRAPVRPGVGQPSARHLESEAAAQPLEVVAIGIAAADRQPAGAQHIGNRVRDVRAIAPVGDKSAEKPVGSERRDGAGYSRRAERYIGIGERDSSSGLHSGPVAGDHGVVHEHLGASVGFDAGRRVPGHYRATHDHVVPIAAARPKTLPTTWTFSNGGVSDKELVAAAAAVCRRCPFGRTARPRRLRMKIFGAARMLIPMVPSGAGAEG